LATETTGLAMTKQPNWQLNQLAERKAYMSRSTTQPSLSASLRRLALLIAVVAITAGATNAFGSVTLTNIPTLPGDTANEGRAIAPDGLWVAGVTSGSGPYPDRGFLYDVTGGNVYNVQHGAQSTIAAGVCYRTVGSQQEIIVGGLAADWNADFMTTNGTSFAVVRRDNTYGPSGQQPRIGFANQRASGGGDVFWGGWVDISSTWYFMAVGKVSGVWQGQSTTVSNDLTGNLGTGNFAIYGFSGTGRAVGYLRSGYYHNVVLDWNGSGSTTPTYFNGLDGSDAGFAYAISADGLTVFGNSPTATDSRYHGYKLVDPIGTPAINQLPEFPDTTGSTYNLVVPYGCTSDGKYAVGAIYRNVEKAVVWDTSDPDPNKWTVLDLTELAKLNGILGIFDGNLRRAYSVGTNAAGLVITGVGYDNTAAATRAFLMTVPLPVAPELTISNSSPAGFTLSYLGLGNATNVLEYTTNLNLPHTWTPIDTNTSGSIVTVLDPAPADVQRFYRVATQ
jgi:hypothetical protein